MNEKILELADTAGITWAMQTDFDIKNMEKFAELIINDCADIAIQHNLNNADRSYMVHKAIKEHFGLE